ncbi:unnamed protein product [Euphydryas editha]|uniref:Uncharacterized protein n=1 Tax=Euphydryas editha TaxID=104508 RepID=A0AAU9VEN8_EUPED|nr:unnamed protein product [Euphydryas editha]
MVLNIASFVIKFCGLGLIIAAGGLWATADVDTRPKNRDEQTLIGGAIWSQTQIPIGLIISMIVDEELYLFLHTYFLCIGCLILSITGATLITVESKKLKRRESVVVIGNVTIHSRRPFDKTYFSIGVLTQTAALLTFADLVINLIQ